MSNAWMVLVQRLKRQVTRNEDGVLGGGAKADEGETRAWGAADATLSSECGEVAVALASSGESVATTQGREYRGGRGVTLKVSEKGTHTDQRCFQ